MLEVPEGPMTYGQIVSHMGKIGDNVEQAQEFRDLLVERAMKVDSSLTRKQALNRTNSNLGYLLGYGGVEHPGVWEEIGCMHPILGSLQREISPSEALQKGIEWGERLRRGGDDGEHR